MPFIEVKMLAGRSQDQKRKVAEGITDVIVKELGVPADHVWVNIQEMPKECFATGGKLRCDQ